MIKNGCCKKLSASLRGITSNHDGDLNYINYLHSFRTKIKLKIQENVCEHHDYCHIGMPKENNRILKHNHREESMKVLFIICAVTECLLEKIDTCHNNPEKPSTTKISKHAISAYSLFTHGLLQSISLIIIVAKTV